MADMRIVLPVVVGVLCKRRRKRRREREVREREWLQRRWEKGAFRELMAELRLQDEENYRKYLRMDTATFEVIVSRVFHIHEFNNSSAITGVELNNSSPYLNAAVALKPRIRFSKFEAHAFSSTNLSNFLFRLLSHRRPIKKIFSIPCVVQNLKFC